MTWPIATWADGVDWSAGANINAFLGAIRERQTACGITPLLPWMSVGDDVQAAVFFASIQAAVEDLLPHFVVSHAAGAPFAAGYYDGKDAIPLYADLAALFSAAGLATSKWRAYLNHPIYEAGVDQERQAQPGDIIGACPWWIFEYIQKCLKALVWTPPPGIDHSVEGKEVLFVSATDDPPTWENAKANAEAAYSAASASSMYWPARAWSACDRFGGSGYWASLARRRTKMSFSGIPMALAHTAEFYLLATAAATGFDANNDDVVEDKWSLVDTIGPTTDASLESDWIGSLDRPNWCAGSDGALGWVADNVAGVIRWDVTGGFEYV